MFIHQQLYSKYGKESRLIFLIKLFAVKAGNKMIKLTEMLHASSNKVVINANFINNNKNVTKIKKKVI